MQWNDITDYFTKKDLLPSSELEVIDYEKLEEEFLRHVFSLGEKPKNVVLFDSEYIDSADSYSDLFNKFLSAMSNDIKVELISSNVDLENQTAQISAKKRSKISQKRWIQDSDWVSAEFLQFVFNITNNRSEVFHLFDPGDQTIAYACIDKKIGDFLKNSKAELEKSGKVYFSQRFENRCADDLAYYPRNKYFDILKEFESLFMSSGSYKISSFENNAVDVFCGGLSELANKNVLEARIKHESPSLCLCIPKGIWNIGSLLPNTDAYVFTKETKLAVLFEANARAAIELLGRWASDDPMPDLILMAKDASWATLISHSGELKNYLVFLGFSREDIENNELVLNINKEPKKHITIACRRTNCCAAQFVADARRYVLGTIWLRAFNN